MTRLRRVWNYSSWAATLLVLVVWVAFLRPTSLGGDANYIVIRGNSMEPAYKTGDLVIVRAAASYATGDSVAYRVPAGDTGAGTIVIHRIIGGDPVTGFVLQGDNNSGEDPWHPRMEDIVGKEAVYVPFVGRVSALIHQPVMLGGLGAALVVTWIVARTPFRKDTDDQVESESAPEPPKRSGTRPRDGLVQRFRRRH